MSRRLGQGTATLAVAVLAACGLLAPTPAGATHGSVEDQATAQAGAFKITDFPAGWKEDIGQNHLTGFVKAAKKIKQCEPYVAARSVAAASPNAESADFIDGTNVASNDTTNLPSLSAADATMAAYRDAATGQCLAKVLPILVKKDLARKGRVGTVKTKLVNPLVPTVSSADATAGYRLLMKATVNGKAVDAYVESWLVQMGRAITSADFESRDAVFDAATASTAVNSATARLAAAIDAGRVGGETAFLKRFLPSIPGYTFEQPPPEPQELSDVVAENAEFINGLSVHMVRSSTSATPLAELYLWEYKPEIAALPGFSDPDSGPAFQDAQVAQEPENGGTGLATVTTVGTTPVWVVPNSAGWAWRLFQCGRVEVWVEGWEDLGTSATAIDQFVQDFIGLAC